MNQQVPSKPVLREGAGGSNGLEEDESEDIPEDWKEKCLKDKAWCHQFLAGILKEDKQMELFGDVEPQELNSEEKKQVGEACSGIEDHHKKKTCIGVKTLGMQLWNVKGELKGERGAKIDKADNEKVYSLTVWLLVGGLFIFLLIAGIILYVYLSKDKKDGGGSKGGKLKSRRNKSGKSTLGAKSSRKSRASKLSHQSKKGSQNVGSKQSFNQK